MREGAIGLGHLVDVLALLDGCAQTIGSVHDLVREALGHAALLAVARVADDPADGERRGTTGVDLGRDLVRGATDAARLDLNRGTDVVHGLLEDAQGIFAGLCLDDVKGAVDDALGGRTLAVEQDLVDELRDKAVVVYGIRSNLAAYCS